MGQSIGSRERAKKRPSSSGEHLCARLAAHALLPPPLLPPSTMDSAALRELAKEREARQRPGHGASAAAAKPSAALPWGRSSSSSSTASSSAPPANLLSAHRSIRLARMFGFGANLLAILCLVLGCGRYTVGILLLGGIGLARAGGQFVHNLLPPMLLEKPTPPTGAEIASAASAGLYCMEGAKSLGTSVSAEYALALDSLAFTCTYGQKNCLTTVRRPLALAGRTGQKSQLPRFPHPCPDAAAHKIPTPASPSAPLRRTCTAAARPAWARSLGWWEASCARGSFGAES
jgi:hypothetical protein